MPCESTRPVKQEDPRVVLRVDDDVFVLSRGAVGAMCYGLLSYVVDQQRRIDEAIEDGNLPHADARVRRLRAAEQVIAFLKQAGVACVREYKRFTDEPLPSERAAKASRLDPGEPDVR